MDELVAEDNVFDEVLLCERTGASKKQKASKLAGRFVYFMTLANYPPNLPRYNKEVR